MLARLINMMGVYFGEDEDAIGTNNENPKGFWERQDVRKVNDTLLHSIGLDWDEVSKFNEGGFEKNEIERFERDALEIVGKLDRHANWLLKEPRLNILLGQWRRVLDNPIYIFVSRTPVEVALSLNARNAIPRAAGVALWEFYNKEALKHIELDRTIFVSHSQIMANPVDAMNELFAQLGQLGVENVERLSESQILEFVSPSLHRQKQTGDLHDLINREQLELNNYLSNRKDNDLEAWSKLDLSTTAKESLEDYESSKRKRIGLEQFIVDLEHRIIKIESDNRALININNQTLSQIDDILETSRWRVGNAIVNPLNRVRGQSDNKPAFIGRVLEIRKRLEVHFRKLEKYD